MKSITAYVNWEHQFLTTDPMTTIEAYLEFGQMTMAEYAVEEGIIDWLGPDEELSDEEKDECITSISVDIEQGMNGWECIEIPIEY